MSKRSKSCCQDLQEREELADVFIFDRLILRCRARLTDQRNLAGVGGHVGTDACVVHAVEADAAFNVLQTMLRCCRCDLVVDR